ncbi:MAG: D-ribose ABC transporter substrate-binding protein [Actinomycetia bacterium]|nr:D-ribose ABC transporter substrate-binding protein [Actinomycetes bacterium]
MTKPFKASLVAVLAAGLALAAGCSSSTPTNSSTSSNPATSSSSATTTTTTGGGGGGLIAVITPAPSNTFFKAESDAAVAEAQKLGYQTQADSHDDDANKQSQLIDSAIAKKAVAIILDNAGADTSIAAVQKATDAGIPVFLIDREINQAGIAKAQIVSNNAQGATLGGTAFATAMGGKGKYIELTGLATDTNAGVRSNGFHGVLDQYPDLKMVAQQAANWDQQKAFSIIETLLQSNPDVTGIISGNDTMAMGAVAAVKAAGLEGKVTIVGFDGAPDAVEAVKAGSMTATVMQPAVLLAQMAVQQADKYLKTGSTGQPEKQSVDCILIDKTNADKYTLFGLSS